ncbi:hypothetical protein CB1_001640007 [Camelus ferus]|nr:hypothetical protein CB1_001640007 [Camelus ferus]
MAAGTLMREKSDTQGCDRGGDLHLSWDPGPESTGRGSDVPVGTILGMEQGGPARAPADSEGVALKASESEPVCRREQSACPGPGDRLRPLTMVIALSYSLPLITVGRADPTPGAPVARAGCFLSCALWNRHTTCQVCDEKRVPRPDAPRGNQGTSKPSVRPQRYEGGSPQSRLGPGTAPARPSSPPSETEVLRTEESTLHRTGTDARKKSS